MYQSAIGNLDGGRGQGFSGRALSFDVYMSNNLEAGTSGKKHAMYIPGTSTLNSDSSASIGGGLNSLVQWGMVTGFFYAAVDA